MLTDTAALALAWITFRIARRPADPKRSYGYHRGQVLAAFVNGALLIVIVAGIAVEAVQRLLDPVPVEGWTMLAVAALGLVVKDRKSVGSGKSVSVRLDLGGRPFFKNKKT